MPKDEALNDDQDEILDDDAVETPIEGEDEGDDDKDDDQEEDDDSQDDDDSDDSDDEEDEPEFTKAFTQLKGDTPVEYITSLEEAYRKSSAEGKLNYQKQKDQQDRLDKIAAVVATNPDLAKLINDAAGSEIAPTVDPALTHARQTMESQMENDYNSFVEKHPELDSDPDLQEKVLAEVKVFGDAARKNGRILSMDDALSKAWISLGLDKDDSKETVNVKAKETASKPKTNNSNKKSDKKPVLSIEQIAAGKKFGLTEKQMLDQLSKKN